jgi:hypothetical protein
VLDDVQYRTRRALCDVQIDESEEVPRGWTWSNARRRIILIRLRLGCDQAGQRQSGVGVELLPPQQVAPVLTSRLLPGFTRPPNQKTENFKSAWKHLNACKLTKGRSEITNIGLLLTFLLRLLWLIYVLCVFERSGNEPL